MIIECNEINPYYVYRHRRLDTFEIFYVGISKVKSRCRNRSTRNKIWKDIINKTKYSVEIIQENLSHSDACELEIFLVQSYGRINLNTGTLSNLTDGGEGGLSPSPEHRLRIIESNQTRGCSLETRKKISEAKKGKPLTDLQKACLIDAKIGIKLSKETRQKMSESSSNSKKVIDTSTGIIYNSAVEVSNIFSINKDTLKGYLLGNRKNKTTFKYLDLYDTM